jgi:hypothetical protein
MAVPDKDEARPLGEVQELASDCYLFLFLLYTLAEYLLSSASFCLRSFLC